MWSKSEIRRILVDWERDPQEALECAGGPFHAAGELPVSESFVLIENRRPVGVALNRAAKV
jgi:hypothetical protein